MCLHYSTHTTCNSWHQQYPPHFLSVSRLTEHHTQRCALHDTQHHLEPTFTSHSSNIIHSCCRSCCSLAKVSRSQRWRRFQCSSGLSRSCDSFSFDRISSSESSGNAPSESVSLFKIPKHRAFVHDASRSSNSGNAHKQSAGYSRISQSCLSSLQATQAAVGTCLSTTKISSSLD